MKLFRRLATGAAVASFGIAPAAATLIDFDNTGCSSANGGTVCVIPQSYGDTGNVDVSTRAYNKATGQTVGTGLFSFGNGYGDLHGIVYGGTDVSHFVSEITLTAKAGHKISLTSFDFATYHNSSPKVPITILDLAGNVLMSATLGTGGAAHTSWSAATDFLDGIVIRWGPDGYNVGVDNIRYEVSDAPEVATWAMMVGGFGLLGIGMRKRRGQPALV